MFYYYNEMRTGFEVVSAIMCLILIRFMIKPYKITGESRYIGLPLGFGFLGATYVLSAVSYYIPNIFGGNTFYIQHIARTSAYLFIATTYYFSKKATKNNRWLWRIALTLSIILITLLIISLLIGCLPNLDNVHCYRTADTYLRVINIIVILYICIHTFRSHIEKPDPTTIGIPIAYAFLAASQYSALIYSFDLNLFTLIAAIMLRMVFLSIFLFVTFRVFYQPEKGMRDEKDLA